MKLSSWRNWGISGQLVTIAVVPATLMFVVISFALYFSGRDQLRVEIKERGALLAAALAESSRYAVVSGNIGPLDATLRGLLALDQGLISVAIVNTDGVTLASVGDTNSRLSDLQLFEAAIRAQIADVDLFDRSGGPHVAAPTPSSAEFRPGTPVGYVRVSMSGLPVLKTKLRPIYWGLAVVLLSALISAGAGLYLARKLRQPLNAVVGALRGIREGNYNIGLQPNQPGELGELQDTIVEMATALSNARQELEDKVTLRTRELQAAIASANVAGEEKQRLISQGNILVEEERRRIAVEIHDHLNASLVFVQLEAQRIASLAGKLQRDDVGQAIEEVAKRISGIAADLYIAARGIVKQLRPEVIDTLGLKGAVQEMVRSYDDAHPDCRFRLEVDPAFPSLPPPLTIAAYRVIQEALSNVVKHARARNASVTLAPHTQGDMCCITIEDDGVGFDIDKRMAAGIGLIGMRERVAAVGGTIVVTSSIDAGTKVTIELPRQQ